MKQIIKISLILILVAMIVYPTLTYSQNRQSKQTTETAELKDKDDTAEKSSAECCGSEKCTDSSCSGDKKIRKASCTDESCANLKHDHSRAKKRACSSGKYKK